jgi:hypothetical protein
MALTAIPQKLMSICDRVIAYAVLKLLREEVETRLAAVEAGTSIVQNVTTRTVTVANTEFAALAEGVKTFTKNIGSGATTAGAVLIGVSFGTFTGFNDGAAATFTAKVGSTSDDDGIVSTINLAAGQTGFPKAGTAGALGYVSAPLFAEQPQIIITSSADLNTASVGAVTLKLTYVVPASA